MGSRCTCMHGEEKRQWSKVREPGRQFHAKPTRLHFFTWRRTDDIDADGEIRVCLSQGWASGIKSMFKCQSAISISRVCEVVVDEVLCNLGDGLTL